MLMGSWLLCNQPFFGIYLSCGIQHSAINLLKIACWVLVSSEQEEVGIVLVLL